MTARLLALRAPPGVHGPARRADPSDEELVERIRRGDHWAQEALYRKHFPLVWGISLRSLGNRMDAEDVVQDAFATALDRIEDLRNPSAVAGWIVQIALRLVHRRFRRRRLLRMLGLDQAVDDAALESLAQPGLSVEARADLAMLERVLGGVPGPHRIAWMLRYVEGYSLEEVASACGCSLATAKRRIASTEVSVRRHIGFEGVVT